jgi:hypothetical protein
VSVHVRELAAWGLDAYQYRPETLDSGKLADARSLVANRQPHQAEDAEQPSTDLFPDHALRADLRAEMAGLDWHLGIVDLRLLLAFQRRLSLSRPFACTAPRPGDADALLHFCFGPPKSAAHTMTREAGSNTFVLQTTDPNLHLRSSGKLVEPFVAHSGSPFLEVACYRNRWFLRDGYHRAYALLQAGIFQVPAVIVHARTLEELGATQSWFFSESTLLSTFPPRVTDFLDNALIYEYDRPILNKTLRVTIEETFAPAPSSGEQP